MYPTNALCLRVEHACKIYALVNTSIILRMLKYSLRDKSKKEIIEDFKHTIDEGEIVFKASV